MQNFIWRLLWLVGFSATAMAQTHGPETVLIETPYGNMKLKLFKETPKHRENFLKLVRANYYDSLMFHRVIYQFMIQGGDHLSRRAGPSDSLGDGDIGCTVPAEFRPKIFHTKGRLAAAREGDDINPTMASSATQFYLVMGKVRTPEDLKKYEERINKSRYKRCENAFLRTRKGLRLDKLHKRLKAEGKADSAAYIGRLIDAKVARKCSRLMPFRFSKEQVQAYTTVGGTPHLDGSYTVFGEVIEGVEVIDKIAAVKTGQRDRPLEDVRMKISILH